MRRNCAASGVTLVSAWFGRELAPNADGGVNGCTGEEPELRLLLENGDGAKKGDGEKGDEAGVDFGGGGGAKGEGSWSACSSYGDSAAAGDVSRFRKGGRPSWNASSSSCASQ